MNFLKIVKDLNPMKTIIIVILTLGGITGLWSYLYKQTGIPEDNIVEETIEDALGIDDITPESPE